MGHCRHWSQCYQKVGLPLLSFTDPQGEEEQRKEERQSESCDLTDNPVRGKEPCAGQIGQGEEATCCVSPRAQPRPRRSCHQAGQGCEDLRSAQADSNVSPRTLGKHRLPGAQGKVTANLSVIPAGLALTPGVGNSSPHLWKTGKRRCE